MNKTIESKRRIPILYLIFLLLVLVNWIIYGRTVNILMMYEKHWAAALTMLFGSFIAGASPEGSAAVSYPVFTLLLHIPPSAARNFSFAIQSIGMTCASLLIIGLKIKVELKYIIFVTMGGIFGLVIGTYLVVPLISPVMAKLFFVSLWLSFGIALWIQNRHPARKVYDAIPNFSNNDKILLLVFGLIGGIISSVFGTGINIFTYCVMTTYYGVSEKVATPSSVIIMTIETILGFFLHAQILKDFQQIAFEMWIVCIPIVAFFAPLGAFVISKMKRLNIAKILYTMLVLQFIGAFWVIKPTGLKLIMCLVVLVTGLALFSWLAKIRRTEAL